ncbi:hypothetical protein L210DRAFT_3645161 [Boletus edulis BED1]|uniref:Uncharacterized protein n=1 Tax=Boletus edulis BED1 TaxID=1328754 RepID=A0AAD4GF57_BOLED|nr:hypothetical protein L210DRAFT_3645161 [Boletus edulis BED1]
MPSVLAASMYTVRNKLTAFSTPPFTHLAQITTLNSFAPPFTYVAQMTASNSSTRPVTYVAQMNASNSPTPPVTHLAQMTTDASEDENEDEDKDKDKETNHGNVQKLSLKEVAKMALVRLVQNSSMRGSILKSSADICISNLT